MQKPSLGQVVLVAVDPATNNGAGIAPAIVTRVWSDTVVNVRVLLDSDGLQWRTSLTRSDLPLEDLDTDVRLARWVWPPRI